MWEILCHWSPSLISIIIGGNTLQMLDWFLFWLRASWLSGKSLFQSAPFVVDSQELEIIRLCFMTQIICLLTHSVPVVLTLIILSTLFTTGIKTAHVQHLPPRSGTKGCKNKMVWKWPAKYYLAWDSSYYFMPHPFRIQFRAAAQLKLTWLWWSSLSSSSPCTTCPPFTSFQI